MKSLPWVIVMACVIIQGSLVFLRISTSAQRRIYWSCSAISGVCIIVAASPDWSGGLWGAAVFVATFTFIAYAHTPYIKLGGKIYSLSFQDSVPDSDVAAEDLAAKDPDYDPEPHSYSGIITETKVWWLLIGAAAIASINIYAFLTGDGEAWVAIGAAGFLALLAVGGGLGDASWGYPIARGQYLQFGLVAAITVGYFPAVYLTAYYLGKHHPFRRKQSLEYRAHPRHRRAP